MRRLTTLAFLGLGTLPLLLASAHSSAPAQPLRFTAPVHLSDPSRYSASDPQYPLQPLPDDEPALAIAPDGTVWVAALHLYHGTALWRGRFGQATPTFIGQPDQGLGGADVALALSPTTPAALYTSSLASVTAPVEAWRITATSCSARWSSQALPHLSACTFYPHLAFGRRDRPWMAAYGPHTVYLAYSERNGDLLTGGLTVRRSDDGGSTWRTVGDPLAALSTTPLHGWAGPLVVNQRSGRLCQDFWTQRSASPALSAAPGGLNLAFNRLLVSCSGDGGVTWSVSLAYQGASGEDDAHMWPTLATDAAGTLYAAWSDGQHVRLIRSSEGRTWSRPYTVAIGGAGLQSAQLPTLAAGAAGHVVLAWYGSSSADPLSPAAIWRVWFAESYDGGNSFVSAPISAIVQRGPLCSKGDACSWVTRQLLDTFGLALDPQSGRAAIAYASASDFGDYTACRAAANCPQTYYVEELSP